MIISYSNNFVVIRAPKTGSTSLVFYFFKSGLICQEQDIYALDGAFSTWQELENYAKENDLVHSRPSEKVPVEKRKNDVHVTFDELRARGAVKSDMPCVGSIRNPLEWHSSMFNFLKIRRALAEEAIKKDPYRVPNPNRTAFISTENPNSYWDSIRDNWNNPMVYKSAKPQNDYFPDHAELFNTENLHEHVSKYILERGGKVDDKINMRENSDNNLDAFLAELTPDRKQDILDTYTKDFELWEKAYAVYN